ncbi:MAG TPA: ROK family protein, partial [Planctomycetota bacterium]|nr:ROK family protein [Planctomycetota bacterium]
AGHRGCYQSYLGGAALALRAREAGLHVSPAELVDLWRAGDPRATAIMRDAQDALAALCRLLVTLLDPELIVIAGGVALATPELVETARRAVDPHPLTEAAGPVPVQLAQLGEDAGLLGAALVARDAAEARG